MKKIFFGLFLFVSTVAFAVHDTTIVDRTCMIEFNFQGKTVEITKSMCKVLLSGQLVYVYDNSQSDHLILNNTQSTYVLDYRQVETPVCPSADSLRKAIVKILNAGNCASSGGGGGTVTSVATGQGLTGGTITGSGTVSVANLGITNAMIANGTINLPTKVNGVLSMINGGTGSNGFSNGGIPQAIAPGSAIGQFGDTPIGTVGQVFKVIYAPGYGHNIAAWQTDTLNIKPSFFAVGSVPFQGSGKRLVEDNANFFYDSINKTLRTTRQYMAGRAGIIPLNIYPNNSYGLYIESTKGGAFIRNTTTSVPGLSVQTDGVGFVLDSKEMALKSTSEREAALFTQTGEASAAIPNDVVSIVRDINNTNVSGSWNATGAMLHLNSNLSYTTSSTGPFIKAEDRSIERFIVQNNGRAYLNTQTDIKQSVSGSLGFDVSQVQTTGSTATDIFTYTVKANTLENDGDELVAKYSFYIAEASKSKTITVGFAGGTVATYTFTPTQSAGVGTLSVSFVKTGSGLYVVSVDIDVVDGNPGSTSLFVGKYVQNSGATLTSNQILKVTATCQAGSSNGGVKAMYAKYYYNPQN